MPSTCWVLHVHAGSFTPGLRKLSFGKLTFFSCNVFGKLGTILFPGFELDFFFGLSIGFSIEGNSKSRITSDLVKVVPSGIISLFRICSLSFSER